MKLFDVRRTDGPAAAGGRGRALTIRAGEWLAIGGGAGLSVGPVSGLLRLVLGDRIGPAECPYMRRWFVQTSLGTVRVHRFLRSDDDRALHDHPWPFVTLVLRGGYVDVGECPACGGRRTNPVSGSLGTTAVMCGPCGGTGVRRERLHPGQIRYRPALHSHRVEIDRPATTLVVSGPKQRTWGFWEERDRWVPWRDFINLHGAPACADTDEVDRPRSWAFGRGR